LNTSTAPPLSSGYSPAPSAKAGRKIEREARRAARIFGTLKADMERAGIPLAEPGLRIAAMAISHELTLVTRNVRHYGRVPDLTVENWIDVDDHK
jgi:predicted nucleic acid-binding protein